MIEANKTYLGKTAGGYIKSCKPVKMNAGNWEVICEELDNAIVCFDMDDNFYAYNFDGDVCRLTISTKASGELAEYLNFCDMQMDTEGFNGIK